MFDWAPSRRVGHWEGGAQCPGSQGATQHGLSLHAIREEGGIDLFDSISKQTALGETAGRFGVKIRTLNLGENWRPQH